MNGGGGTGFVGVLRYAQDDSKNLRAKTKAVGFSWGGKTQQRWVRLGGKNTTAVGSVGIAKHCGGGI